MRCRSLINGKIFSGGPLMLAARATRNESGLVAAKPSTPAMATATMIMMVLSMNPSCVVL